MIVLLCILAWLTASFLTYCGWWIVAGILNDKTIVLERDGTTEFVPVIASLVWPFSILWGILALLFVIVSRIFNEKTLYFVWGLGFRIRRFFGKDK